jgi:hypothetical protein
MKNFDMRRIAIHRNYIQSPLNANFLKIGNGASVHEPDDLCALKIAPKNIGLAVSIEVTGSDDGPDIEDIRDKTTIGDAGTVHQPHGYTPSGVTPQDVRFPSPLKSPTPAKETSGGMLPTAAKLRTVPAIHKPDCRSAIQISPQDVCLSHRR